MTLKASKIASDRKTKTVPTEMELDYPLQGSKLDVPLAGVLALSTKARSLYISSLIKALKNEIDADRMALKTRIAFQAEMRDIRNVFYSPADKYLFVDESNGRRWVLGKGSPGSTHVNWSRSNIWRMKTKIGSLEEQIRNSHPSLTRSLGKLFDRGNATKEPFRDYRKSAIQNALRYLEFDKGSGCAFPPFHAKFLADKYLPRDRDSIVFDPCAGWGGRLLGSLLVNRKYKVYYIATDPEERNRPAYEGLTRRVTVYLKKEIKAERQSTIHYEPFEDFICRDEAKTLFGKVDLVLTSPPYFGAENYNPTNPKQSANRYANYYAWRDCFYRQLMKGAYDLLRVGGHFVLNIADVAEAPRLERDARILAREVGFVSAGFYRLAMSLTPASRKAGNARHVVYVNGKVFKYEPVFVFRKPSEQELNAVIARRKLNEERRRANRRKKSS